MGQAIFVGAVILLIWLGVNGWLGIAFILVLLVIAGCGGGLYWMSEIQPKLQETKEREAGQKKLDDLYQAANRATFPPLNFIYPAPDPFKAHVGQIAQSLYLQEFAPVLPPPEYRGALNREHKDWMATANRRIELNQNNGANRFDLTLRTFFNTLFKYLPSYHANSLFEVDLIDNREVVLGSAQAANAFWTYDFALDFRLKFHKNRLAYSQTVLSQKDLDAGKYLEINDHKGTPRQVYYDFYKGTIFEKLLNVRYPFPIPDEKRFQGTWIIGNAGHGKTNLLWHLIANDRKQRGTVVIMDSKGELLNPYRGYDDVVIIDPKTTNINPFQLGDSDQAMEVIQYIFSIVASAMTEKQQSIFYPVLRLVTKIPGGSVDTFRKILTLGWRDMGLQHYLDQCDTSTRDFFTLGTRPQFEQATYNETKNEILWRIQRLLSTQLMQDIFLTTKTNVPFKDLLDSGKTILINNNINDLGVQGAEFFGRFFLALTWMAAVGRTEMPDHKKMPVYFYIDEAQTVIANDVKVPTILDECRSQKIALIMAHQRLNRITSAEVKDALFNCAVRFASVDNDAPAIASRFNMSSEQLMLPPHKFACYVRGQTPIANTFDISFFDKSQFPSPKPKARPTPPPNSPKPPLRIVPKDDLDFG